MEVYITTNYCSCNHETVIRRRKNKTCAILFWSKVGHFEKRESYFSWSRKYHIETLFWILFAISWLRRIFTIITEAQRPRKQPNDLSERSSGENCAAAEPQPVETRSRSGLQPRYGEQNKHEFNYELFPKMCSSTRYWQNLTRPLANTSVLRLSES